MKKIIVCMNPLCKDIFQRIFYSNQLHLHKNCQPWYLKSLQSPNEFPCQNLIDPTQKIPFHLLTSPSTKFFKSFHFSLFHSYFFSNQSQNSNDLLLNISYLLSFPIPKISFSSALSLYQGQCPFCKMQITSKKQYNNRNGWIWELLQHIGEIHRDRVREAWERREKGQVEEVTIKEFLERIDKGTEEQKREQGEELAKIEEIVIIDRQNVKGFNKNTTQQNPNTNPKLYIEVVNKNHINLPQGMYISTNSTLKDSADLMITLLVYELLNCKIKIKKITIVTNDKFASTLSEIVAENYGDKLEDGLEWVCWKIQQNKEIKDTKQNNKEKEKKEKEKQENGGEKY